MINNFRTKVIAHRGDSSHAPENTLSAFNQAINASVDFLECDVQLTKDGVPVVVHDRTFHRITNDLHPHSINELDLKEIKTIDAGSWFDPKFSDQKIMTLEEFLFIPRGKIGAMLEIKEDTFIACALGKNISDVLKAAEPKMREYGPVIVGSLSPNVLLCMEAYLPQQQFIPIVRDMIDFEIFTSLHAKQWAFKRTLLTKEIITAMHSKGCEVWVWTVDEEQEALEFMEMGVDGIITNHPGKMMHLVNPSGEKIETITASRFQPLNL